MNEPGAKRQSSSGSGSIRPWRNSVFAVFTACGFALSSWVSRIPTVRDELEATTAELGIILLGLALGSLIGLMFANRVLRHLGPRVTAKTSLITCAASLVIVGLGSTALESSVLVFAGLTTFGVGSGSCNVAMNVEGASIEQKVNRSIMPLFHASYSLGGVLGATLGAVAASMHLTVASHLCIIGIAIAAAAVIPTRNFRRINSDPKRIARSARDLEVRTNPWLESRTLLIGLVVMATSFAAGAASNWLALAMVDGHGVDEGVAAITYGLYILAVTFGRLGGVIMLDRFGRVHVLQVSAALAAIGLILFVVTPYPALAMIGALLWGLGTALGFPVGMSAATDDPVRGPGRIGVVATIGYSATLVGPPVIGFLGGQIGILSALFVVLAVVVVGGFAASSTRRIRR